jgi:DNA-binding response OmpR family regulator
MNAWQLLYGHGLPSPALAPVRPSISKADLEIGELRFLERSCRVFACGSELSLSIEEYTLLRRLAARPNRFRVCVELIEEAFVEGVDLEGIVHAIAFSLNEKLTGAGLGGHLRNEAGLAYKLLI